MNQGEGADSKPKRCEGPKFGMVRCGPAQSFMLNIFPNAFNHFKKKSWITPKPLCGQNTYKDIASLFARKRELAFAYCAYAKDLQQFATWFTNC